MGAWDSMTAAGLYGVPMTAPASAKLDTSPGIATAAGPSPLTSVKSLLSPQHPVFMFGALLAAAAGLIGIAGSARFGPAKAGVSLGKA